MKIIGYLVTVLLAIALRGYVAMQMWNWFVQPLGAQAISMVHSLGIVLFVNMFLIKYNKEALSEDDFGSKMVWLFTSSLTILGLGYLAHMYM